MHVCDRFSFSGRKVWKLPGNCVKGNRESWLSWDDSVFQNVVEEQAPKGSWSVLNTLCSNMTFRALTPGTKYTFFKLLSPWLGTYCHLVRESTRPVKNVLGIYWQFHSRKLSLVNISVEELKVLDWHLIVFQKDSHCHNRKRNMYIRDHWLGSTKREPISATESLLSIPCRSCHWPSFILETNCPSEKGVREEITYLRRAIRLTNTSFRYKSGA